MRPHACAHTRLRCFKKLQLSQSGEHCLKYQLWAFNRKSFKLRCLMNAIFLEYQRFNLDKNKNDRFWAHIRCPGRATASLSTAPWPGFYFQRHHHTACWEIARHFDSARSFPHILRIYTKSTATPTYHRNFALAVFFSGRKFQTMPW